MKQTADISMSKLVIVLTRAYRSLAEFLEGGVYLQGACFMDFMILEALLHKGPLPTSVIGSKIGHRLKSGLIGPEMT
jgi:MarR family transcriptional regulator, 2-MHQ and catechol-resistance regulon repressor